MRGADGHLSQKRLSLLGSTGSIGRQTLDVVDHFPDRFRVVALAAGKSDQLLVEQALRYRPELVTLYDAAAAARARARLAGEGIPVLEGMEGLLACARLETADLVVSGMVGSAGLIPTYEAVRAGKDVALANKETLVAGGPVVVEEARRRGVRLLPVDSEHSGAFQCLQGVPEAGVRRLYLTASGGPFRGWSRERLEAATVEQALQHPTWRMGPRITIDSATLMNKGLEVIEAHWLFGLSYDQIEVLIHPESIVHALVETTDGAVMAQLSRADMRLPILYSLTWPERAEAAWAPLDLAAVGTLHFAAPDREAFPCLDLAYQAGRTGGTMPAVLNAAKEVVVDAFLAGRIGFLDIARIIYAVMESHQTQPRPTIEDILAADAWARDAASTTLKGG